jgi:hypothetical protein
MKQTAFRRNDGVRPSSGAAALERAMALALSTTFLNINVAAPEDGRTPLPAESCGLV